MKPCFARGVIMPGIDRLSEYMRVIAAHPGNFLFESNSRLRHQVSVASIPKVGPMLESAGDALARRLNGVFAGDLRIERW